MTQDRGAIESALHALRGYCDSMPPVAAMRFRFDGCDGAVLRMSAPLAANVNDKGSAFGGSMTSLMTFAGWGLVMLRLQLAGLQADVFVADSQVRYLKPVYADLKAEAWPAQDQPWETFLQTLARRGRARIHLQARVLDAEGEAAATLAGRYVAITRG
jgi:thioesterase domain-containing protein